MKAVDLATLLFMEESASLSRRARGGGILLTLGTPTEHLFYFILFLALYNTHDNGI